MEAKYLIYCIYPVFNFDLHRKLTSTFNKIKCVIKNVLFVQKRKVKRKDHAITWGRVTQPNIDTQRIIYTNENKINK